MADTLPLMSWQKQVEIDRLAQRRAELCQRIEQLRPHCHRRVVLVMKLQQLTLEQIQLENQLRRDRP
ncbi:hypothetical protein P7F60_06340 [Rhizobium sp. YJ-22]|uniref:hypothetical protein n=1 Tax=Rhizobium sp. YJ-22 TaxID=3037556 RepID=UPI002412B115|nr:hypothetical protein [Rhizobium sp. YJ-22]MDG3575995.1 hypothetical protein [Rhizobium sp. YJ-22]